MGSVVVARQCDLCWMMTVHQNADLSVECGAIEIWQHFITLVPLQREHEG
jgi:hypothetical protein